MIVSWNWLTDYLRLDMSVEELTERLALTGLNLESIEDVGGDIAIDLEVTSNRPDCLGHLGVAREISVVFGKEFRPPDPRPETRGGAVELFVDVSIEAPELCSRFTARAITGVKTGESPWWLRKRLETLGVRPISNIVDVTNYVMFECGQPLHAYDLDRLSGRCLVARRARTGERLTAINNRTYELNGEMLAIADDERPVGLAGVMGGIETEIGPGTTSILIEAARFDAMSVRRTSRALGLFSPSSFRFERPMDPEATEWASRRCAELVLEVAGGTLHPGVIDVGPPAPERAPVRLRLDQIERALGIRIDRADVDRILRALGLAPVSADERSLTFQPPSWRSDLEREIDLIEEAARIHGYHHIPEDRAVPLSSTARGRRERVESAVREVLNAAGLDEAVTFSLVGERLAAPLGRAESESAAPLRIEHSSRKRENALRRSLVPSLLAVRAHNESRGQFDADLFEIANVYLPREGTALPHEPTRVSMVAGRDFRSLKGVVEALLARLHVAPALSARAVEAPMFAAGRAAELRLGPNVLGYMGELDLDLLQEIELRGECAAVELDLDVLLKEANLTPTYRPLPQFPPVTRDLSLVVARDVAWADLERAVVGSAGAVLESVEHLDTFEGGSLPEGHWSVHFGMVFRHPERTLTGEEVEAAVGAVLAECEARFRARPRS